MNKKERDAKKIVIATVAVLVLACVTFTVLVLSLGSTMDSVEWGLYQHIIEPGETLWEIAQEYCPESVDCREWIRAVIDLNGMQDGTIYAGDVLTVLVPV